MTRKIRFTVEVEIEDLSDKERAECARLDGVSVGELPKVDEYTLEELTDPIAESLSDDEAIWSGTGVYAHIASARVVACKEI